MKIFDHKKLIMILLLLPLSLLTGADQALSYCLIRAGLGGPGGREDCCDNDPSQWLASSLPVPMWINEDTDPELWEGIRLSYDIWTEVPSAHFSAVDSGFTPRNFVDAYDGINLVSFSNDSSQFPPGSNTIAFTSGNWGTWEEDQYVITGFDVIFNDVGFDFGYPPGSQEFSVVGITNHELGHAWGIAHCYEGSPPGCGPNCTSSTMYGFSSRPDIISESLELDDVAAISLEYPKWVVQGRVRDAGTTDPIPGALVTATAPVAKDTLIYGGLPDPLPGNGSTCAYVGGAIEADDEGRFEIVALDSVFDIVFFMSGYMPDTVHVELAGIDTVAVGVNLEEGLLSSITGTLTDESTTDGISASIVLMQNDSPYDTAATDPVTGEYTFSDVPVSLPPFLEYTGIEIVADIPYPQSTIFDSTIVVVAGTPTTVDLAISPADVFLVDDDEGDGFEDYFMDEIVLAGRTYHHFDVDAIGESPVYSVRQFPISSAIVWFTGNATSNIISPAEQDSLAAFLDRGGNLFLTGQNITEFLDASGSSFLDNYLYAAHEGNVAYFMGLGVWNNPVTGFLEDFVTSGSGGANNQTSRDDLIPTAPAEEFIFYVLHPGDLTPLGTAALYVDDDTYKAVLMGFGFEAIANAAGDPTRATREETMLAILNWFDGISGIGDGDGPGGGLALPRAFALHQNYPNPFNPQTTIQLDKSKGSEKVTLTVYNLRGQLMIELLDKELEPGLYTVQWDGRDQKGRSVPSGIYLYNLTWGDRTSTRKMVVLK
jgi:hypothetical protein